MKDAEFYLACSRRNETMVKEEYCWAIRMRRGGHAAAYRVPVCWILVISPYTNTTVDQTYTQFRLAPYLPQISHKSRSVYFTDTTSYPRRTKSMAAWIILRQRACASVLSGIGSANGRGSAVRTAGNKAGTKGMNRSLHFSYPVVSHFVEIVKPCRLSTLRLETNRTTRTAN